MPLSANRPRCRRLVLIFGLCCSVALHANPRARDLGVPFPGDPGPLNAITDVAGVEVGHTTLIEDPADAPPVRSGVTALHPLSKNAHAGVAAAWFALNGTGEMTGTPLIDEFGTLYGPVLLTTTLSVGVVRDAAIAWAKQRMEAGSSALFSRSLPLVAETWDGELNDIYGFHVRPEHVFAALDSAQGGPVAEGNVGGGTGMVAFDFKSGIGTSSRLARIDDAKTYTVGVLVQSNCAMRSQLTIAGVPVGQEISELMPARAHQHDGSIIIIIATDAPLLPGQLKRLAKRATMGLARTGSFAAATSGDLFLAFSTANTTELDGPVMYQFSFIANEAIDPLLEAVVNATEEAIVNSLVAAQTMQGVDGMLIHALPHARLQEVLRQYGRLQDAAPAP